LTNNLEHQKKQFYKFLRFDGEHPAYFIDNYDIYKNMSVFTFLRDIGKQITVNYMMSKESVKNRLETGISFTEFSYQLIQGYDFLHLLTEENCILQMGGGDQWGNITTGLEFIRKNGKKAFGLTTPLLTRADGKKFGKSEVGNIWLDPNMTSPYKFYQFWLNLPDEDLPKLWRTFSLRSLEEIQAIEAEYQAQPNEQKRLLAVEMTDFVHSEQARKAAEAATQVAFHPKLQKSFLESLSVDTFELLCQELPHFELAKADLAAGLNIVELLAEKTNILSSKSEARKAIKNNAIAVNSEKVQADTLMVQADQLLHGQFLLVENGKKNKYLLRGV
jgi:tyrosyl-tRNA synthetase